jgi:hypothetical protein
VPQEGIEGFTITVDRVFVKDGVEVIREPMTTVYNAGPDIVCKKKPKRELINPGGSEFDNLNPSPAASQSPSASATPE